MKTLEEWNKIRTKTQVFSRNNGYLQPIQNWNEGKVSEWGDRQTYDKQLNDK